MIFCKACGTALADDARYCTNCGQRVEEISKDPTANGQPANRPHTGQSGTTNNGGPSRQNSSPNGASPAGSAGYGQNGTGFGTSGGFSGSQNGFGPNRGYAGNGYGYSGNGCSPNGYPPNGYPGAAPQPRRLNEGQLVFAIVNMVLGLIFGAGLMALVSLWPLLHVLNARSALSDEEEKDKLRRAKRANIVCLCLNLLFPILLLLVAFGIFIAVTVGVLSMSGLALCAIL